MRPVIGKVGRGAVALVLVAAASAQAPRFQRLDEPLSWTGIQPPRVLATADFDGDGTIDVLAQGGVRLNDGAGRLRQGPPTSLFDDAARAFAADVDGDGDADVVAQRGFDVTKVLLNDGVGGFTQVSAPFFDGSTHTVLPLSGLTHMAAADFDFDGMADLVGALTGAGTPPRILRAIGNGVFVDATPLFGTPPAQVLDAYDVDGDGDVDCVCVGVGAASIAWSENTGGSFAAPAALAASGGTSLTFPYVRGDFDGDGNRDDLAFRGAPLGAAASATFGPYVLVRGPGGFVGGPAIPPAGGVPSALAAADVDGDGIEELLSLDAVRGYLHAVVGGVVAATPLGQLPYSGGAVTSSIPVDRAFSADLDGDGDRDVLAVTRAETWRTLFAGAGALRDPDVDVVPAEVAGVGTIAANLNGDAYPDLLLIGTGTLVGGVAVGTAIADGRGGFVASPGVPGGNATSQTAVAVADFNGDGYDDAMMGRFNAAVLGGVVVFLSDGAGGGTTAAVPLTPPSTIISTYLAAATIDLHGDGDRDVALLRNGTLTTGALEVMLNDGAGAFSQQSVGAVAGPLACGSGDLDGDGDEDLVVAAATASYVYWNVGGTLQASLLSPTVSGHSTGVGDLDADGDLDLLIGAVPFLNDGSGSFSPAAAITGPLSVFYGARIADFDLDGHADAVFAGMFARGLGAGAFAPAEPILPYPSTAASGGSFFLSDAPYSLGDFDVDGDLDLIDSAGGLLYNVQRQLARGAPARPGRNASLRLFGAPSSAVDLVAAAALLPAAVALGPWGALQIDPASFLFALPVALDASGLAEVGGPVPNVPALVGATLHWQAVHVADARLSRVVTTVVEGF